MRRRRAWPRTLAQSWTGRLPLVAIERTRRRTGRIFHGWWIVVAGMGMQALQNALLGSSYGAYTVLLQDTYGWNKTVFSAAFSLQQVESGILGPFQGWLLDRFGPRAVMRAGIVLFGIGFMLFSQLNSIATFYGAFLVIAVGTSLGGFLPIAVTLVNWFERRRSTAMGIMQTGMGIGGLCAPLVAWSLNVNGWRATAFASGVLIIVVGLPLTKLMRHRPEDYGLLPDGDLPDDRPASAGQPSAVATPHVRPATDFTPREALRTRSFWFVSIGHACALLVVSAVMVHLVPHLKERLGYSVQQGAAIVAIITTMSMIGQLGGGFLGDRLSKRYMVTVCMLGHGSALLLLANATALWMVVAFAVLHGLSWGTRGPLMQTIRADYFGRTSYGTIMGFSNLIVTVGMVTGPLVAGILYDRLGDYHTGFTVLAVLAGCGSVFWVLATKPPLPVRAVE